MEINGQLNNNEKETINKLLDIITKLDYELCTVLNQNDISVTGNLTGDEYENMMDYADEIDLYYNRLKGENENKIKG